MRSYRSLRQHPALYKFHVRFHLDAARRRLLHSSPAGSSKTVVGDDRHDDESIQYPRADRLSRPAVRPEVYHNDTKKWSPLVAETSPRALDTPEATEVKAKLELGSAHPSDVLQTAIGEGKASLDVVWLCMEKYAKQLQAGPSSSWVSRIAEKPIAAMALRHIWSDESAWLKLVLWDYDSLTLLAFFAEAEGLSKFFLECIKLDLPASQSARLKQRQRFVWRNNIFRALVRAKLSHGRAAERPSADEALKLFFAFLDLRTQLTNQLNDGKGYSEAAELPDGELLGLPAWMTMSTYPAWLEICQALGKDPHPYTVLSLYERFINFSERYALKGNAAQRELSIARLYYWHPSRPSADKAVTFLRREFESRSVEQARDYLPTHKSALTMFENTFKDAERVARRTGRLADAQWLSSKSRELESIWRTPGWSEKKGRL